MRSYLLLTLVLFAACVTSPASAQSTSGQKSLGMFGAWRTYSYTENKQPVCYMAETVSFPKSKKFKRGSSYLMITERPAENSKDVVSFTSGYNFKAASDVKITVGKRLFHLFTTKDTAWSRDAGTDRVLTAAIRAGPAMKINGVPDQRGVGPVTDILNIKGAAQAYMAVAKACGIEVEAPPKPAPARKKHK